MAQVAYRSARANRRCCRARRKNVVVLFRIGRSSCRRISFNDFSSKADYCVEDVEPTHQGVLLTHTHIHTHTHTHPHTHSLSHILRDIWQYTPSGLAPLPPFQTHHSQSDLFLQTIRVATFLSHHCLVHAIPLILLSLIQSLIPVIPVAHLPLLSLTNIFLSISTYYPPMFPFLILAILTVQLPSTTSQ